MHLIDIALVLLLAVAVSGIVARLSPIAAPTPLIQIGVGVILSAAFGFDVRLEPDVFFLLFIPPLLFFDGWRIPKRAFFRDRAAILTLAVGLVIVTVLGIGLLVHAMIPLVPLTVAFALAAILSPTDAVAVSAVAARTPIPPRLMNILAGEALFNDASGLVCFRVAVAAAVTGTFSFVSATLSFIVVAVGGLLAGIAIAMVVSLVLGWLTRRTGEEPGIQVLVGLLIPFAAYLAAERVGVSGILAAVAAGFVTNYIDLSGRALALTRMQRKATATTAQVTLNGMIFVLLGQQLPNIFAGMPTVAKSIGVSSGLWLIAYIVSITVALALLRFMWAGASITFASWRARRRGKQATAPSVRLLLLTALAGVRGAVTLAGILTLPLTLPDGTSFPARGLAIFLSAGVILLSLVAASFALPLLAQGIPPVENVLPVDEEEHARSAAAEAAIRKIEELRDSLSASDGDPDLRAQAAEHVAEIYRRRLEVGRTTGDEAEQAKKLMAMERRHRLAAIQAERDEVFRLRRSRAIDDHLLYRLVQEFDLAETSLATRTAS